MPSGSCCDRHARRAAHELHEAGIVHRDMKPGNVLLADCGGGPLSDLGQTQVLAPGVTVTGMGALPSVEFMEPDLLRGEAPARASDVFSLGVTLHRVLTGRGMYGELPAHDPVLALRRVFTQPPRVDPDLEPGAAAVVRCATAPRRADRPAALELAELIDGLIGR